MGNRYFYGMEPTQAIAKMNQQDDDMQAWVAAAAGSAGAAQGYRDQANSNLLQTISARDAAIAASQVAAAPTENLAAYAQLFHVGNMVSAFLYDTSKDSDLGAWRKRCKHTSWENEPLVPGKWISNGPYTLAGAQAAGGVTGDYFQGNDGKFYQFTSASTIVEVFRGNTREFPALALIVAEAARVVIYDATKPNLPMWMVFLQAEGAGSKRNAIGGSNLSAVAASNGKMYVTDSSAYSSLGVGVIDFIRDADANYSDGSAWSAARSFPLSQRNTLNLATGSVLPATVSVAVNAVAAAVLPDAPVDPATGLPVPTIWVATAAGASRIAHDGTVSSTASSSLVQKVWVDGLFVRALAQQAGVGCSWSVDQALPAGSSNAGNHLNTYWNKSAYYPGTDLSIFGANNTCGVASAFGGSNGLSLVKENPSATNKGMFALITNSYNTGWMVGDIRGCWLADTVAETITGTELVTNGTFDTDTSGWSSSNGGQLSAVGGKLRINANGNGYGGAVETISTVPGRAYVLTFETGAFTNTATITAAVRWGANLAVGGFAANGKYSLSFVASDVQASILFEAQNVNTAVFDVDNVSCKLAVSDRSVKGNGLQVNGSLTKSPVATGAQLISFHGFSYVDYLELPANSGIPTGQNDMSIVCWATASSSSEVLLSLESPNSGDGIVVAPNFNNAGVLSVFTGRGPNNRRFDFGAVPTTGTMYLLALNKKGNNWYGSVNGQPFQTPSNAGSLDPYPNVAADAVLRVGNTLGTIIGGYHTGSITLVKVSATTISDDQIAQIYRDGLALFQPGAQCVIAGNPTQQVTALGYDSDTELLHVGTNWGYVSSFHNLLMVESQYVGSANDVGGVAAISASNGAVLLGGTISARYTEPSINLRDELRRKAEARRALARELVDFDFDSGSVQTAFTLPIGFEPKQVYVSGSKKRQGATKDYTVSFDGYRNTVNFGVTPGATWVSITANRSM